MSTHPLGEPEGDSAVGIAIVAEFAWSMIAARHPVNTRPCQVQSGERSTERSPHLETDPGNCGISEGAIGHENLRTIAHRPGI
jgi:hypothetical protein